ncbi:hypothetical protein PEDI_55010 [Persicobacter diffluens]|uniref:Uncharacterized protein n=1 Tax=Persicobacter diffluens TaxID=981 RepID=A0AAN4W3B3_9BACT|nr:hypothetical protein PEDI_55010 [Persicobacter diffluens]
MKYRATVGISVWCMILFLHTPISILIFLFPIIIFTVSLVFSRVRKRVNYIWDRISNFVRSILTSILLAIAYFILVTPIGFIRRHLTSKSYNGFSQRNYTYSKNDFHKPW